MPVGTISHQDIYLMLGRLEAKLDASLQRQDRQDLELRQMESDIQSLQQSRSIVYGVAAAVTVVISIAEALFFKFIP